jgi:hypothetical protein
LPMLCSNGLPRVRLKQPITPVQACPAGNGRSEDKGLPFRLQSHDQPI